MKERRAGFSIPFNGNMKLLSSALGSGKIDEVYFSAWHKKYLVCNNYGGREGGEARLGAAEFKELISLCRKHKAGVNLLCNSPSLYFTDLEKLFSEIKSLDGITAVTVSDPLAAEKFVGEFPGLDVQASFIMNLDKISKLRQALEKGIGTVVLPSCFYRNVKMLEEAAALKKIFPRFRIKLIANLDCAADCFYLPWHYMLGLIRNLPSPGKDLGLYSDRLCFRKFSPADFIRIPFIRPEDIDFYFRNGLSDGFKLIYRSSSSAMLEKVYAAYFAGSYDGNLFDIFPTRFERSRNLRFGCPLQCSADNAAFPDGVSSDAYCMAKKLFRMRLLRRPWRKENDVAA